MGWLKIRVKNLRPFGRNGKWAEFEINPLTILIGPNNSGKSTLSKLVRFVYGNVLSGKCFKTLTVSFLDSFGESTTFDNLISYDSNNDVIHLEVVYRDRTLSLELTKHHLFDNQGYISKMQLSVKEKEDNKEDSNKEMIYEVFEATSKFDGSNYKYDIFDIKDNDYSKRFLSSEKGLDGIQTCCFNDLINIYSNYDSIKHELQERSFTVPHILFSDNKVNDSIRSAVFHYLDKSMNLEPASSDKSFVSNVLTFSGVHPSQSDIQIIESIKTLEKYEKEISYLTMDLNDFLKTDYPEYYVEYLKRGEDVFEEVFVEEKKPDPFFINYIPEHIDCSSIYKNESGLSQDDYNNKILSIFNFPKDKNNAIPTKLFNLLMIIVFYRNFEKIEFDFDLDGWGWSDFLQIDNKEMSNFFNINEYKNNDKWAIFKWDVLSIFYDENVIEFLKSKRYLHNRIMKELHSLVDFFTYNSDLVLSPSWLEVKLQEEWIDEGAYDAIERKPKWENEGGEIENRVYPDNEEMKKLDSNLLYSHMRNVIESFSNYFLKYLVSIKPKLILKNKLDELLRETKITFDIIGNEITFFKDLIEQHHISNSDTKKKSELSNFGTGLSNDIRLRLLLLFSEIYDYNLSIYEEPESHLHPQNIFGYAEEFIKILKDFNNEKRNYLIETHSEHLIRGLQVLVAKENKCNPVKKVQDNIIIYNFSDDPTSEDYIREIRIQPNGMLSNKFSKGFYDEASRLISELYSSMGSN